MRLPEFEHVEPVSLPEAVGLIANYGQDARVMGGGTELLISLKHRLRCPAYVIGLRRIPELNFVTYSDDTGLRIGALTPLATLIRSPLVQEHFPVVAQAARSVAVPAIRTKATLGGNLCQDTRCFYYNQSESWRLGRPDCFKRGGDCCSSISGASQCYSAYQGDMAPVLIALDSQAMITSDQGQRLISLADLYTGSGEDPIALKPNELLTELQIPPQTGAWGGDYQKLRYRDAMDFPLVGVAAFLAHDGNREECQKARIVLTAVSSAPVIIEDAGRLLQGKRVDKTTIERAADAAYEAVHPIATIGSTPFYRRKMVRVLTRRALSRAWEGS